jgi:hypothetical protein
MNKKEKKNVDLIYFNYLIYKFEEKQTGSWMMIKKKEEEKYNILLMIF